MYKLTPLIMAPPYPEGIMISANLNLLYMEECFNTSLSFLWQNCFCEEELKDFSINS